MEYESYSMGKDTDRPDYHKGDVCYPVPGYACWPHLFVADHEPEDTAGNGKWYYGRTPANRYSKATPNDAREVQRLVRQHHERAVQELRQTEELAARVMAPGPGLVH